MKPGDLVRIRFPASEYFEDWKAWNGHVGLLLSKSTDGHPSWLVLVGSAIQEINALYLRRLNAAR